MLMMLYVKKYYANKILVNKMSVAELKMLRWICSKTKKDRIRNKYVLEMIGVTPIER